MDCFDFLSRRFNVLKIKTSQFHEGGDENETLLRGGFVGMEMQDIHIYTLIYY